MTIKLKTRRNNYNYQPSIPVGINLIAGVDEVGRGPLAGPVVAAAVILNPLCPISGLADSKALTAAKREQLSLLIQANALSWAVGRAEVNEIDNLNIFHAGLLAMKRAVEALSLLPEFILVDGTHCPNVNFPSQAIVNGDATITTISAASIIAKVTRDREMIEFDKVYPGYGFAEHKGYSTAKHLSALSKLGVTPLHRRSFAPVKNLLTA